MERPSHAGLRHLALNVRHLDEMKRFYVDLLGFTIEWQPDPDNIYLSSGIDNLALHRSAEASRSTDEWSASRSTDEWSASLLGERNADERTASLSAERTPLDHLGLIVRAADDVDRWASFLEARGVTIDAQPRTHRDGARSCYFRDPDGNRIQIIHHPPISGKA
jgi:catechol 2,3-dioxygenase-like lactoylglutathione lyase family enzyme